MLARFLIMLREGLEAALIVGIIAGYLRQTGRREWLPAIWVGVFLVVAMSLFAGAAIQLVSAGFPQKMQELFEALIGLVAVAVLVGMVFWMRRAARSIRAELHADIDEAVEEAAFRLARNLLEMSFQAGKLPDFRLGWEPDNFSSQQYFSACTHPPALLYDASHGRRRRRPRPPVGP